MMTRATPPSGIDAADDGHNAHAPLATPFAAGPGGFLIGDDLEPRRGKYASATVVLAVIILAGGLLVGMRKLGMGPKLDILEIQIDYPLEEQDPSSGKDHGRVLADLRNGGNIGRIPLDMVQTNPFTWRTLKPLAAKETPKGDPAELLRLQLEEQRKKVADAAQKLVLNSVMGGRIPMARISGELARVGDTVAGGFRVKSIIGRIVTVESGDQAFTLSMGDPDQADKH